jgi:hypothetical protein
LSKPVEGGGTQSQIEHLRAVWKQTGRKPLELDKIPEPPRDLVYLWNWLNDLIYPMSYSEVIAWGTLTGRKLAKWEVAVMMRLDRVRSNG